MHMYVCMLSIFALAIVIADKLQLCKLEVVKISEMIQRFEQRY